MQVQFVDQAGILQLGDEISRRQEAFHRIDPPGQGFFVTGFSAVAVNDRLVVNLDPAFRRCPVDIFQEVLPLFFRFPLLLAVRLEKRKEENAADENTESDVESGMNEEERAKDKAEKKEILDWARNIHGWRKLSPMI